MTNVAQFKSHASWLHDAGVEFAVAEGARSWLQNPVEPVEAIAEAPFVHSDGNPGRGEDTANTENHAPSIAEPAPWPDNLAAFATFLAQDNSYPGSGYGRRRVLPQGQQSAKIAVVTDFPSASDIEQGQLLSGNEGQLVDAMLAAIGCARGDCYILSIATSRPASGELDEREQQALIAFALHHLALATAGHVLLLGDTVSRLLTGLPMLESRGSLRIINHNGVNMAATNCFHPRTLLARPQFKRQAWQDLQMLMKELSR